MARFQTVIKSARFVCSPYTATERQGFAQVLADAIRARIQRGQNTRRAGRRQQPTPNGCPILQTRRAGPGKAPFGASLGS